LIVQNIRDAYLLENFVQIFGCGHFFIAEKSGIGTFAVSNFSHIIYNIIPFFEKYPILGVKAKDFEDFKKASVLVKSKAHLTKEGLNEILLIKSKMNFKR
jgi:LAGLIDADG endonuclease